MLCSRSASLTSKTRMSSLNASRNLRRFSAARSFSDWASIFDSLVTPSTSRATDGAEQFLDLFGRGDRIFDRVVKDRRDDGLVVQLEIGQDAGDLDRVAEIRVARCAHLGPVRLHRKHIGAVDQRLVGVGIIGPYLLDQFILPEHRDKMGCEGGLSQARKRPGRQRGCRSGLSGCTAACSRSGAGGCLNWRWPRSRRRLWRRHCTWPARPGRMHAHRLRNDRGGRRAWRGPGI